MSGMPYYSDRGDSTTEDPLLGFNFLLELEGAIAGYFSECSGVGSENEIVEHKVVDKTGHEVVRKLPGRLNDLWRGPFGKEDAELLSYLLKS